jgi:hypothetical protein
MLCSVGCGYSVLLLAVLLVVCGFAFGATILFGALTSVATGIQTIYTGTPAGNTSFKSTVVCGYLTTYSATEAALGLVYLRQAAVDKFEARMQNTDLASLASVIVIPWGDGLVFSGAEVVSWHTNPAAATSTRWTASLFGQG